MRLPRRLALALVAAAAFPVAPAAASAQTADEPPTDLYIEELTPERDDDGRALVHVTVDNTGGRAIEVVGHLELVDGPGGVRAGPFHVAEPLSLAPERLGTVAIPLDTAVGAGPWRAVTTLRSGSVVRAAEVTLAFPPFGMGDAVPAVPVRQDRVVVRAVPALLLLTLLVLAVGWRQRQQGHRTPGVPPGDPRPGPAGRAGGATASEAVTPPRAA